MNNQEAVALLDKYLAGECSQAEYQLVNQAYNLEIPLDGIEPTPREYEASRDLVLSRLQKKFPEIRPAKMDIWPRFAAAAAVVLTIGAAILFYQHGKPTVSVEMVSGSANDVAPGKNQATLTFADGKVVVLKDDQQSVLIDKDRIAYGDGSTADKMKPTGTILAQTPRGGTYKMTLPDGTKVWLNNDTKLYFPAVFTGAERRVKLEGEAYFEVASSFTGTAVTRHKRPFSVESRNQEVKVLGTHFNVEAYNAEELTNTTLLEGRVQVTVAGKEVILSPGQQAITEENRRIGVREVDTKEFVAWKDGDFLFNEEPLYSIARRLARWYDVDVIIDQVDRNKKFTGKISRRRSLSRVLNMISKTSNISFKVEGRRVTAIAK